MGKASYMGPLPDGPTVNINLPGVGSHIQVSAGQLSYFLLTATKHDLVAEHIVGLCNNIILWYDTSTFSMYLQPLHSLHSLCLQPWELSFLP